MNIIIRKTLVSDAENIVLLIRSLGWFKALEEEPLEVLTSRLQTKLTEYEKESHSAYVAVNESGKLAGYTTVQWMPCLFLPGCEGYVSELFLNADFRGQGTGTRLLDAVKQEGRQRGCTRLMLINNKNRESYTRDFYKKNGWTEREQMVNFIFPL